jgi:hypothetical protein
MPTPTERSRSHQTERGYRTTIHQNGILLAVFDKKIYPEAAIEYDQYLTHLTVRNASASYVSPLPETPAQDTRALLDYYARGGVTADGPLHGTRFGFHLNPPYVECINPIALGGVSVDQVRTWGALWAFATHEEKELSARWAVHNGPWAQLDARLNHRHPAREVELPDSKAAVRRPAPKPAHSGVTPAVDPGHLKFLSRILVRVQYAAPGTVQTLPSGKFFDVYVPNTIANVGLGDGIYGVLVVNNTESGKRWLMSYGHWKPPGGDVCADILRKIKERNGGRLPSTFRQL